MQVWVSFAIFAAIVATLTLVGAYILPLAEALKMTPETGAILGFATGSVISLLIWIFAGEAMTGMPVIAARRVGSAFSYAAQGRAPESPQSMAGADSSGSSSFGEEASYLGFGINRVGLRAVAAPSLMQL